MTSFNNAKKKGLFIALISILLIAIIGIGVYSAFFVQEKEKEPVVEIDPTVPEEVDKDLSDPSSKPDETNDLSNVQVNLVEYTTYCFDDLSFNFIIAKVRVKSDEAINISLEHFVTSENINLNDVDKYLDILDENKLYIGKQRVSFELLSHDTSMIANIFIPVIDKTTKTITVDTDFNDKNELVFSLENATGTKEMLGYVADDVITDGKTYEFKVSTPINITGEELYNGDTQEYYSSSTQIYAFYVNAVSLWGDSIVIEDAKYITSEGIEFTALSKEYTTMKRDNIIGKEITEKETLPILFMTLNYNEEPITYKGNLLIKVKGQDKWIEVQLDF